MGGAGSAWVPTLITDYATLTSPANCRIWRDVAWFAVARVVGALHAREELEAGGRREDRERHGRVAHQAQQLAGRAGALEEVAGASRRVFGWGT
jgi:hypothetical protein